VGEGEKSWASESSGEPSGCELDHQSSWQTGRFSNALVLRKTPSPWRESEGGRRHGAAKARRGDGVIIIARIPDPGREERDRPTNDRGRIDYVQERCFKRGRARLALPG